MQVDEPVKELVDKFGKRAVEQFQAESATTLTGNMTNNYLTMFAAYYSNLETELAEIKMAKAVTWLEIREKFKSDTQAERYWDAMPNGQRQIQIESMLKAIKQLISACKSRLTQLQTESFNSQ